MSTSPDPAPAAGGGPVGTAVLGPDAPVVRRLPLPRLPAPGSTGPVADPGAPAPGAPAPGPDTAFAAGFAAGYADGLRRASEEAARDAEERRRRDEAAAAERRAATTRAGRALAASAGDLATSTDELVAAVADAVAAGTVALARAVLRVELSEPGHRAATALHRAVTAAAGEDAEPVRVTVRMHPDDVRALDVDALPEGVGVTPDPSLQPGDARATSGRRWVDARVGEALERAARAVAE